MAATQVKRLRLWLIILLMCLLFTFALWDHYFNSNNPIDQKIVSNLILVMGILFSAASALFSWSLESARDRLEKMVDQKTDQLRKRNEELERAFQEINVLQGLIPICAGCKKVRDDKGYWEQIEIYLGKHSGAQFTHGLCKDCAKKIRDEFQSQKAKATG